MKKKSINIVKNEKNKPEVQMKEEPILELIKKRKMFFVCDMDEEAEYLHEMSLQGYHFASKKGSLYSFQQGEPKNYFYHLGYHEEEQDEQHYIDTFKDAGWESVYYEKADFGGVWNYFRIEMEVGETQPVLFGDRDSRLSLYHRLLTSWKSLLVLIAICLLFLGGFYTFIASHPSQLTKSFTTFCAILACMMIVLFVIYFRSYVKISKKYRELKKRKY